MSITKYIKSQEGKRINIFELLYSQYGENIIDKKISNEGVSVRVEEETSMWKIYALKQDKLLKNIVLLNSTNPKFMTGKNMSSKF